MNLQIRPCTPHDLPAISEMIAGIAAFHGDDATHSLAQLRHDLCADTPWFRVLVAEDNNRELLGYAALVPTGQLQYGMRGLDMHHLFVQPDARRKGVGAALVTGCLHYAREAHCTYVSVGTHPDNAGAGLFYETLGFARRSGIGPRFNKRLEPADQPPT
ncbi:MAG: GNAT family N-acetyltransferase [Pseudomonadota bacterium]